MMVPILRAPQAPLSPLRGGFHPLDCLKTPKNFSSLNWSL
jgi:hypothetical protein